MAGLKGISRLPRDTQRARRNAAAFSADIDAIIGDGLEITAAGLLAVKVQDPVKVDSSGVGLNYSTGLQVSGGNLITNDSEIDHNSLANYSGAEHINWTNTAEMLSTSTSVNASLFQGVTFNDGTATLAGGVLDFDGIGSIVNCTTIACISITSGNMTLTSGSITDTGGTINFGNEHLTTQGNVTIDSDSNGLILGDDQDVTLYSDGAGAFKFKAGAANTDLTLTFEGTTSTGVLKWMEDEDYFQFLDDVVMDKGLTVGADAKFTGSAASGLHAITVYQSQHERGLQVRGVTSPNDDWFNAMINASGYGLFTTNKQMLFSTVDGHMTFNTTAGASRYVYFISGASVYFNLGDAAGATHLYVRDSGSGVVFDVDSDGNVQMDGHCDVDGTLDWSANECLPKIYSQDGEPALANNTCAFWVDTNDANRTYLVLDVGGGQTKIELT